MLLFPYPSFCLYIRVYVGTMKRPRYRLWIAISVHENATDLMFFVTKKSNELQKQCSCKLESTLLKMAGFWRNLTNVIIYWTDWLDVSSKRYLCYGFKAGEVLTYGSVPKDLGSNWPRDSTKAGYLGKPKQLNVALRLFAGEKGDPECILNLFVNCYALHWIPACCSSFEVSNWNLS